MDRNWGAVLLAAVSAFYFGFLHGQKTQVQEIVIDGKRIQLPKDIYDSVKGIIESVTK